MKHTHTWDSTRMNHDHDFLVVTDKPCPDLDEPVWTAPSMDGHPPFTTYRYTTAASFDDAMEEALTAATKRLGMTRIIHFVRERAFLVATIGEAKEI